MGGVNKVKSETCPQGPGIGEQSAAALEQRLEQAMAAKATAEDQAALLAASLAQAESRAASLSRQLASTASDAGQRSAALVRCPNPPLIFLPLHGVS